jgi:hypothetical protein
VRNYYSPFDVAVVLRCPEAVLLTSCTLFGDNTFAGSIVFE